METMNVRFNVFCQDDRWNPITWCDTYEEAVSFCKSYSLMNGGAYGICCSVKFGRKDWYDLNGFICCNF